MILKFEDDRYILTPSENDDTTFYFDNRDFAEEFIINLFDANDSVKLMLLKFIVTNEIENFCGVTSSITIEEN